MSKSKPNIWILSALGASLATLTIAVQPIMAEEVAIISNERDVSLLSSSVSTKARDLLSATQPKKYLNNAQTTAYKLVQRELDLEKFCQDYPYNARCHGSTPSNRSEPTEQLDPSSPIPVPVSPPAPPARSNSSQNNLQSGWAIVPEISTLGLGGQVVRKIVPQLNARVGVNAFGFGFDLEETDIDYDADLNLFNVSTILDYHPAKGSGFKLGGGLVFANNNIEGTSTTDQTIEIGDREFSADQLGSVDADIEITRDVAPYLGIGWGNAVGEGKGLGFWFNAGVIFGGSPEIEVSPNISDGVSEEVVAEINEAAEQEEEDLEDELDFISIYPVVSLGFSYQF